MVVAIVLRPPCGPFTWLKLTRWSRRVPGRCILLQPVKAWYWINYPLVDGAVLINLSVILMNWLASMHNLKMAGWSIWEKKNTVWLSPWPLNPGEDQKMSRRTTSSPHHKWRDKWQTLSVRPMSSYKIMFQDVQYRLSIVSTIKYHRTITADVVFVKLLTSQRPQLQDRGWE